MVWAKSLYGFALLSSLATPFVSAQAPGLASIPLKGPRISFTCPDGSPLGVTADNGRNAPICSGGDPGIFSAAFFLDNNFNQFSDTSQTSFDTIKAANAFAVVYYLSTVEGGQVSTGQYMTPFYEYAGGSDPTGTKNVYLTDYSTNGQRYLTIDLAFLFYLQPDGRYKIQSVQRNNEQLANGPDTGYWQINSERHIISPVSGGPNEAALFSINLSPSTADYPASPTEDLSLAQAPSQQGTFNLGFGSNFLNAGQTGYALSSTPTGRFSFLPSTRTSGLYTLCDRSQAAYVSITSTGLARSVSQTAETEFIVLPLGNGYYSLYTQINGGKYVVYDTAVNDFVPTGDAPAAQEQNLRAVPIAAVVSTTSDAADVATSSSVTSSAASSVSSDAESSVVSTTTAVSSASSAAESSIMSTTTAESTVAVSTTESIDAPVPTTIAPSTAAPTLNIASSSTALTIESTISSVSASSSLAVESVLTSSAAALPSSSSATVSIESGSSTSAPAAVATLNFNFVFDNFDYPMIAVKGFTGSDGSQPAYDGLTWSGEEIYEPSVQANKLFGASPTGEQLFTIDGLVLAFDSAAAATDGALMLLRPPNDVEELTTDAFMYDATLGKLVSSQYKLYLDETARLKVVLLPVDSADQFVPFSNLSALPVDTASPPPPGPVDPVASSSSTGSATTSASATTMLTASLTDELLITSTDVVSVSTSIPASSEAPDFSATSFDASTAPGTSTLTDLSTTVSVPVDQVTTSSMDNASVSLTISLLPQTTSELVTSDIASSTNVVPVLPVETTTVVAVSPPVSQSTSELDASSVVTTTNVVISSDAVIPVATTSTDARPTFVESSAAASVPAEPPLASATSSDAPVAIPSAGLYTLRADGAAIVCVGSAIVVDLAPAAEPSVIAIDNRGVLSCDGKVAMLKPQAVPSPDYDILLIKPPSTDPAVVPGFFGFINNVLVASLERFARRKRQQGVPLYVGLSNGQLIAGPNVSPNGLTVVAVAAPSGSLSATAPTGTSMAPTVSIPELASTIMPSSQLAGGSVAPLPQSPSSVVTSTVTAAGLPVSTVTQTLTVTQGSAAASQVTIIVQVIITTASVSTVPVYATVGGVLVQIDAAGLPYIQAGVQVSGSGAVAPVIVNVVTIVAPVVVVAANGGQTTKLTTVTGFVTAIANGLPAGPGGVTIINTAAVAVTAVLSHPVIVATGAPNVVGQAVVAGAIAAVPVSSNGAAAAVAVAVSSAVAAASSNSANSVNGVPRASANAAATVKMAGAGLSTVVALLAVWLF